MGSLAILAKALGHRVSGSDEHVYPPMSNQLEASGIVLSEGYAADNIAEDVDLVVVGNAMSRGNAAVEHVLNRGLPYISGPQWLAENVLRGRWVIAVAGTHGKTTTTSMLAWILEYANLKPGFLIGGVPTDFGVSARLGETPFFVIEADEYDTAFFDKRSKFVHYLPRTAVLNNLEFDHADIFDDLAAIQRQFHHFVRTIPGDGLIVAPADDENIADTLQLGCWTSVETMALRSNNSYWEDDAADDQGGWSARKLAEDGSVFEVGFAGQCMGEVAWKHTGDHNVRNALAAIAAARHVGVKPADALAALSQFQGVKRRMELLADTGGIRVYDDFAHHPTAIASTLASLRNRVGKSRIIAVIEPRSNTMRMGIYKDALAESTVHADLVYWYKPESVDWDLQDIVDASLSEGSVYSSIDAIVEQVCEEATVGDQVVIMSNGGFGGIHRKILDQLSLG